jgi:hypothetical protein
MPIVAPSVWILAAPKHPHFICPDPKLMHYFCSPKPGPPQNLFCGVECNQNASASFQLLVYMLSNTTTRPTTRSLSFPQTSCSVRLLPESCSFTTVQPRTSRIDGNPKVVDHAGTFYLLLWWQKYGEDIWVNRKFIQCATK